ncbi:MAG: glycosyltransferase [Proteobacteria bacterium]|nr:glycosyltransferase [Pseudomonadota bacterium]
MSSVVVVIPCYNETRRLASDQFGRLVAAGPSGARVSLLFVDDGSTDSTRLLLESLRSRMGDHVDILALPENRGKAEAVRAGLGRAVASGADITGYIDADLATPVGEVLRLIATLLDRTDISAVIGSRIAYLGTDIRRRAARHYLGRMFASAASLILGEQIYDTQCGAKFFRTGLPLTRAIDEPFHSRWAFDVELLGRFLAASGTAIEVPLVRWSDVSGSKMKPVDMVRAGLDLIDIARHLSHRRRVSGQR